MKKQFHISSRFKPTNDQQKAIDGLASGVEKGIDHQVLLGVTGSGKTFTMANVIQKLQRPTLIISHNKTLAGQLYQEFRDFFPDNAVSYFVSYYDYYQPEAYIPSTDTYIEKDAGINELIDKLRLAATTNLLTRSDTIIVASVSCIYNIGSPKDYSNFIFNARKNEKIERTALVDKLLTLQYDRGDFGFHRGTFRIRGNTIDIHPAYQDLAFRLNLVDDVLDSIEVIDPVSGNIIEKDLDSFVLFPAKHYIADPTTFEKGFKEIKKDMLSQVEKLKKEGKELEAHRIKQRVTYDLDMIKEVGYVKGIENYSRYFDGRAPGDPPNTLLEYFNEPYNKDWLVLVDESHITFPQIRGMYAGDLSRKKTLIDYGFRLPSALDNRPLTFEEFMRRIPNFIGTSATPGDWELSMAQESAASFGSTGVVEQLLRPTGIPDPEVEIRPTQNQVADVIKEIELRAHPPNGKEKERVLVTTLTKKMAEDLTNYLKDKNIKVQYLHSDVKTLERTDILEDLRRGNYDCIVGVNLLREGLDLPEVSLVAILDADKEGFLRSEVSLIQTMGRAARHIEGMVILYADRETKSIKKALSEVGRRREYQIEMNKKMGITPQKIDKPIREKVIEQEAQYRDPVQIGGSETMYQSLAHIDVDALTPRDKTRLISNLRKEMKIAAQDLHFELAAEIRDKLLEIEGK